MPCKFLYEPTVAGERIGWKHIKIILPNIGTIEERRTDKFTTIYPSFHKENRFHSYFFPNIDYFLYKPLAYQKFNGWHAAFADGYWPENVPAGAYITHKTSVQQGYLKSIQYESTFVPANGVLAFHKANGTYKLGIPMIKATNYNNANAYWIKAENRWMTLQEYKDTQE